MSTRISHLTIEQCIKIYTDLLKSTPDGWGQHVHPTYGRSDNILYLMYLTFGKDKVDELLDKHWKQFK
ncbi:hypothetical protein HYP99_gp096 [Sinorhizobium phage ort11]|uniref:Uncharacterized protein n=1 Tax=Sinorhizobium phage ort11 TaxID=2599764 RepID=A0A5C2H1F8_9CAUD|nr:hypothetical protein HYP99_gp096 [Sinorhizobium phage ort11]QEP29897.1 hypothetical protein Smphiort11_099 [Sinorhizobium phage ort11]